MYKKIVPLCSNYLTYSFLYKCKLMLLFVGETVKRQSQHLGSTWW